MKKTIAIIAVALAITFLASGILTGCNANNSASAANAGKNTAKKIDMTLNRLENLNDEDFGFPSVFGNDFFIADSNTSAAEPVDYKPDSTSYEPSAHRINTRRGGYHAKHFGENKLNQESKNRVQFLDKVDDLYVLCADVSAINTKCKAKVADIKKEVKELKTLSRELQKSHKRGRNTFAKFNFQNRQVNESVTKLNRDRNNIKTKIRGARKNKNTIDVEANTMHNLMLINKLENRLRLLEDTYAEIVKLNDEICVALGKVQLSYETPPINQDTTADSDQQPTLQNAEEQLQQTLKPRSEIPADKYAEKKQRIKQWKRFGGEQPKIQQPIPTYEEQISEQIDESQISNRNNEGNQIDEMPLQNQTGVEQLPNVHNDQLENQTARLLPVIIHRFHTLPYKTQD